MKRDVDYTWRLAELMANHQMHNSTDLIPRLNERGITLSRPQVYRLVHQRPERVSLKLIAALCDIFDCGPEDLVTVTAANARKKAASAGRENVVELNKAVRPYDSSPLGIIYAGAPRAGRTSPAGDPGPR